MHPPAHPQIIVALDVASTAEACRLATVLRPVTHFVKVGLELFTAEGPDVVHKLNELECCVFLDLKLHDIPRTVERAVHCATRYGVTMLTIHASGGREMMQAAMTGAAHCPNPPAIIAVTTLTSLNQNNLTDLGISRALPDHTLYLARQAVECGVNGLVSSPNEVRMFRDALGDAPILVTPGIRPSGTDAGDQKRIATPAGAVDAGATFLVIGRPIVQAENPLAAASAIRDEMIQCAQTKCQPIP